jgi:protein NirF
VNFAFPHNGVVQVIDVPQMKKIADLSPGRVILHMEFTPRGEQAWVSSRDDNVVVVYDTRSLKEIARLPSQNPSGIFMTSRAAMTGF